MYTECLCLWKFKGHCWYDHHLEQMVVLLYRWVSPSTMKANILDADKWAHDVFKLLRYKEVCFL